MYPQEEEGHMKHQTNRRNKATSAQTCHHAMSVSPCKLPLQSHCFTLTAGSLTRFLPSSALVVNIDRPWLYAELFNDYEIDIADDAK